MIKTPTVLVLGAGASVPYGLASGAQLREMLCELPDSGYAATFQENDLYTQHDLEIFSREFLRSGVNSIDRFLAQQPKHQPLGKLAIAAILCSLEQPDLIDRCGRAEHWYAALWNAMIYEVETAQGLVGNQVRFVTFNYDRSLEYFLHSAISNTFGPDNGALAGLSTAILHVYGQLGGFCAAPREGGRTYTPDLSRPLLQTAAEGIRIIPEARIDEREFLTARAWFEWAERVFFLGFSFDPLNVLRLGLADVAARKGRGVPAVFASVYDMTPAEVSAAASGVCGGVNFNAGRREWKCLDALREFGTLVG